MREKLFYFYDAIFHRLLLNKLTPFSNHDICSLYHSIVFTFGIIASCLALASYDMVNKYGKDIHFKKDGSQEKSNLAVISWIQNGILTNAILSVVVIFIFEIFR